MEEEATNVMGPPSQLPSQPPNVEEAYGVEEPYKMDEANQMEEDATQPSTQLMIDPRRLGEYDSDLSDEDAGDILCIFHPASLSAIQVAANITEAAPEHTVSRAEMPLRIKGLDAGQEIISPDTMVLAEQGLVTRDLALRLSAKLKDPLAGFVFGRNVERCDFVLTHAGKDGAKRISNIHFRVWVTENGVIMLEDQSTNGTVVEGKLLRSKSKEPGHSAKHTLTHGTLIKIHMISGQNDDIQFVVRIPKREEAADELWTKNMHKYFERLDNARARRTLERARAANGNDAANGGAPDLFADQNKGMVVASRSIVSNRSKEWTGGRKYNKQHVVGKGAFATVYLLTDKYTGDQFAAKEIEKRKFMKNGVIDAKIDQEMKIMEDIRHDNIVKFIECVDWSDHLYLIMEFAPEGTLSGLIDEIGPLSENDTKDVASQMLSALAYLHERGIAHRDIKPDNVLVKTRPPNIHVQLTDFGLSKKVLDGDDTFLRTFCGTILYCAPEVYPEYLDYFHNQPAGVRERAKHDKRAKRYDHMVDVWSLAGLLFFCLTKLPPYSADHFSHHTDMLRKIMTGALDVRPLQKMDVTELGISFLKSMLNNMPQLRATIAELLEHKWLTGAESFVEESIEEEVEEEETFVNGRQVFRGLPGESFHLDTQMTDVGDLEESNGSGDNNDDGSLEGSNGCDRDNDIGKLHDFGEFVKKMEKKKAGAVDFVDENLQDVDDVDDVEHEGGEDVENVDPLAESGLEQSASQLSIVEAAGCDLEDEPSEPSDEVDFVDLVNFAHDDIGHPTNRASYLRGEIPDSIGSDSFVSFDEQFAPQQTTPTAPRLFGEVNLKAAALDFPLNELAHVRTPILANVNKYYWNGNTPRLKHDQNRLALSENRGNDVIDPSSVNLPDSRPVSTASTNQEAGSESDDYTGAVARQLTGEFADANTGQHTMEHTTEHARELASADSSLLANSSVAAQASGAFESSNTFAGAGRAPSLLGAESMVGDMAINSPGPIYSADASSDNLNIYTADNSNINTASNSMLPAASLRRPREADEDDNGEDGRPAAKRHHSITVGRLVNGPKAPEPDITEEEIVKKNKGPPVPASVFFDPTNKLTHHLNYPTLSVKEYEGAVNLAKAQGEDFMHGGKLFNMVIKTYQQGNGSRRSSTSSMDSWDGRAQSEPIEGNEAMVAQDQRGMSESRDQLPFGGKYGGWVNGVPTPEIAKFFPKFVNYYDDDGNVRNQTAASSQMGGLDGFRPPKRILAKFVSTADSVIPNITITITETLTTWGRGFKNTVRYEVNNEDRIPKNALKLILWAHGMKPGDPVPVNKDNEHAFYIATKATHGIKVNNVPVQANEPAEPQKVPANYWGRLQHGDIIVAWSHALQTKSVVKFRFYCFWGASAKPRAAGDFFDVTEAGPTRDALNRFCQWEESRVMKIKFEADMREKAIRDSERGAGRETPSRGPSASSSHTDDGGRVRGFEKPGSGLSFSQ